MKQVANLILILFCTSAFAQIDLTGTIKSKDTAEPLPFVNIGVIGKGIGTVSDDDGLFYISLKEDHTKDSMKISMVGFKSKTFLVGDLIRMLQEENEILLKQQVEELEEVLIFKRRLKTKILGNRSKSRKNLYEASADLLGSEIGIKIKIKRSPTRLKRFNTRVLTKKHSKFKFRLNFYNIKDGLPNNNLLKENIIIDANDIKDGWVDINLEPYDIYVDDDFFVTLEWIQGEGKRKLQFPASLFGPTVVERDTSQAEWNKHTMASIGFNVTVEY